MTNILLRNGKEIKIDLAKTILIVLILFVTGSAGMGWGAEYRTTAIRYIMVFSLITIAITKKIDFYWLSILYMAAMVIGITTSSERSRTILYARLIFMMLSVFFVNFSTDDYKSILRFLYYWSLIVAVSVFVSAISPSLFLQVFWPLHGISPSAPALSKFLERAAAHQYSGLGFEISETAVLCNFGIAYKASGLLTGEKITKRYVIEILILFGALMLTAKRTLFVIPFVIMMVFFLFKKSDLKKKIRWMIIAAVFVSLILLVMTSIPQFSTIFARFTDSENIESMGGREYLWMMSGYLFQENPIFGVGYYTYNSYAEAVGLPTYFGHNIYLQLLAEGGVIGFVLVMGFYAIVLIVSLSKLNKTDNRLLWFSCYVQILFFIYGMTGNVLSYYNQLFMWIFVCRMALGENKRLKEQSS